MRIKLKMPMLAMGMTEGVLAEWLVEDGTGVTEGMAIYSVENDKSTVEVPSPAAGTLRIIAKPGGTYQVGEIIAVLE